jgi:hypothetical protein
VSKRLLAAALSFERKAFSDATLATISFLATQYPQARRSEIEGVLSHEEKFEIEFQRKMRERLSRDLPKALSISDPVLREAEVRKIMEREQRYSRQREEAMLQRALGKFEARMLMDLSPEGAYWKLSPFVKAHTLDCLAMGNKFWPWSVLKKIQPPLHAGCPCYLLGLDEAVAEGLMSPDLVPDEEDALLRYEQLKGIVDELEDRDDLEEALAEIWEEIAEREILEEAAKPLRWGKGVAKGGQFRPRRGGNPGASIIKKLLGDGSPPTRSAARRRGRWTWIRGVHTRVPEQRQWSRKHGGRWYTSPAGSTNVYRDGKLISAPGMPTPASERVMRSPGVTRVSRNERIEAGAEAIRASGRIRRSKRTVPVHEGDGPSELLNLMANGYVLLDVTPRSDGTLLTYADPEGEQVAIHTDESSRVKDVAWGGTAVSARESIGRRAPKNWDEFTADTLAWADQIAARYDAPSQVPVVTTSADLTDHAGSRQWSGAVVVGRETHPDITRAGKKRAVMEPLTEDEMRGVYSSYWVTSHEVSHGINPISPGDFNGANANLEEALAEELSHAFTLERLTDQGQLDVVDWALSHPEALAVKGVYEDVRGSLRKILDRAGADNDDSRQQMLEDLKFNIDPGERLDLLAGVIAKIEKRDPDEVHAEVEKALGTPPPLGFGDKGHVLDHAYVPPRQQIGAAGRLSSDGKTLTMPDGSRRVVEMLPLIQGTPELEALTDGAAIVHYRRGEKATSGLKNRDGTPKNFRYIDSEDRAKIILRSLSHGGTPFVQYDPDEKLIEKRMDGGESKVEATVKQYRADTAALHEPDALGGAERAQRFLNKPPEGGGRNTRITPYPASTKQPWEMTYDEFAAAPETWWHGTKWGTIGGGDNPVHVGNWDTAHEALAANVAGQHAEGDVPEVDGEGRRPVMLPFRIDGPMASGIYNDFIGDSYGRTGPSAEGILKGQLKKGQTPHQGYFYKNEGEGVYVNPDKSGMDALEYSISAVMPNATWVKSHEEYVREALKAGKDVPVAVRAEYGLDRPHPAEILNPKPPASPGTWLPFFGKKDEEGSLFGPLPPDATKPKKKVKKKPVFVGGEGEDKGGLIPSFDGTRYELGGFAGGSNGARWAFDEDGNRWLLKTYHGDTDRVAAELLGNRVYAALGVPVAESGTVTVQGKPAMVQRALKAEPRKYVFHDGAPSKELGADYMADALVANWDYIGMEDDNILWDENGTPIRVDQGGTFEYKAMGGPKPYGPVPTEVWTMIQKGQAKRGADVTEDQMREQGAAIEERLTPEVIDSLIDATPFANKKMKERVRRNLKARVKWMGAFSRGEVDLPRPLTGKDARDSFGKQHEGFELFPEEIKELTNFIGGGAVAIDAQLKVGEKSDGGVNRSVKVLDNLLKDAKTDEDMHLYVPSDLDVASVPDTMVGQTLGERAYIGAFTDREKAEEMGDGVIRILVPEGSHAIHVPTALGVDEEGVEPEVLIRRGSQFRIEGVKDGMLDATLSAPKPKYKPFKPPAWQTEKKKTWADEPEPEKESSIWDDIAPPQSPGTDKPKLTPAQQRILDEVTENGEGIYSGGARKSIKALEKAGLVTADWNMVGQPKGGGITYVDRITVRPVKPPQSPGTKIEGQPPTSRGIFREPDESPYEDPFIEVGGTPYRPGDEGEALQAKLDDFASRWTEAEALIGAGIESAVPQQGYWGGESEPSFAITGHDPEKTEAIAALIGQHYHQDAMAIWRADDDAEGARFEVQIPAGMSRERVGELITESMPEGEGASVKGDVAYFYAPDAEEGARAADALAGALDTTWVADRGEFTLLSDFDYGDRPYQPSIDRIPEARALQDRWRAEGEGSAVGGSADGWSEAGSSPAPSDNLLLDDISDASIEDILNGLADEGGYVDLSQLMHPEPRNNWPTLDIDKWPTQPPSSPGDNGPASEQEVEEFAQRMNDLGLEFIPPNADATASPRPSEMLFGAPVSDFYKPGGHAKLLAVGKTIEEAVERYPALRGGGKGIPTRSCRRRRWPPSTPRKAGITPY